MIEQLSLIKQQNWVQKLSDVDIEIFNISYTITEKFGDTEECVIDLEDVFRWTGYSDKSQLKTQVLEKNFEKDIDNKILEEYTEEFLLQKIRSKVLLIKK